MNIDELVDKYVCAYGRFGVDRNNARCLFELFPDNIAVVDDSFCVFVRVSDDTLWKMKIGLYDMRSLVDVMALFSERGDNIHVLAVVGNSLTSLRKLSRRLGGKSLSWFERDLSRFVCFKRR